MLLTLAKKTAYRFRHYVRDSIFRNNQPMLVNLRYSAYQRKCRKSWPPTRNIEKSLCAEAARFRQDGFMVLPPKSGFDFVALKHKIDDLFEHEDNRCFLMDGLYRMIDGIEQVPELASMIDDKLEAILESYYGSYFKVFGIYIYRTLPNPKKPQSSFLWHIDNCPASEIKLMVYLDDVSEETGAIKLKKKSLTDAIRAKGFRSRDQVVRFQGELEDRSTSAIVEGPAGTRILFENGGVMHKATAPSTDHRDVVTFVIIPSDIPWRVHFARNKHRLSTNAGACVDPRLDTPQYVGYEY